MIKVNDVHFAYSQEDQALKGLSFEVSKGEWVSILGHNGSGKSTISKLLVGLMKANSGSIYIDGQLLDENSVYDIRKKIGIVFQNPDNQFVGVNVRYDIAFGLENRCVERDEMKELINKYSTLVSMYEYLEKEPSKLSGGQKQRVAIAGILALNTDIIILDEATSMLDPEGKNDIIELVKELRTKYNKTIITVTHDLEFASLSDRIIVLKDGKSIADGKPNDVFKLEDILNSTNLDMPFNLRVYKRIIDDPILSKNKKLVETLWQSILKM